ncbi:hypothetical protein V6617_03155 [Pelagibacterium nitratireducens]|uniref:Uncharacterized protein n=1 Tax=Pelagibacterium nitratireducens TaxID=1046114 RepID=A0ABZ2I108_9HYPH
MFTKPLSGRSYATALLIRAGVILAVFAAAFTLFSLSMGDCSAGSGACGAGMAVFILAALATLAIFVLSIVGISVRRARDAGWHPLIGLFPVLLPFVMYTPLQGILVLTGPLFLLFMPLFFPPLSIAWLATIAMLCFAPTATTRSRQSASNRPPRI